MLEEWVAMLGKVVVANAVPVLPLTIVYEATAFPSGSAVPPVLQPVRVATVVPARNGNHITGKYQSNDSRSLSKLLGKSRVRVF